MPNPNDAPVKLLSSQQGVCVFVGDTVHLMVGPLLFGLPLDVSQDTDCTSIITTLDFDEIDELTGCAPTPMLAAW